MHGDDSSSQNDNLITVISLEKAGRRRGQKRVRLSDESWIYVLDDVLEEEGIGTGTQLDPEKLGYIVKRSEALLAERHAFSLVSRSLHSKKHLQLKLKKKGHTHSAVATALQRLEEMGYVDDVQFAETWISLRLEHHPSSRAFLLAGLLKRGVSREIAQSSVTKLVPENVELENAHSVVDKMKITPQEIKKSLYNRGYRTEVINQVLRDRECDVSDRD